MQPVRYGAKVINLIDGVVVIGSCAALCSVASFLPQAWRIVKTRDTKAISTPMYELTVAGFAFWIVYGFELRQWPIIAANGICFVSSAFILMMKLVPARLTRKIADGIESTKQ